MFYIRGRHAAAKGDDLSAVSDSVTLTDLPDLPIIATCVS